MRLHKEGRSTLIIVGMVLIVSNALLYYNVTCVNVTQIVSIVFSVFLFSLFLNFFRNPKRTSNASANDVIAPADGEIVVIEKVVEDEYFNDERLQLSIFMSPFDVHVNRNPISGIISYFKYHPGKYLMAFNPKSSTENEKTSIVIKSENGLEVLMRQIAGFLARRIVCYVKESDTVQQGEDYGFIKFGSRIDLLLPVNTKINVELKEKVRGGETVIAELSN
ncbi:MAG: phosphatidylserine decarboxylase family protein [Bacteroidia bacterium]|nr:phosphatidylserine decarboxylase family protein [Bacteroidia bacterium]